MDRTNFKFRLAAPTPLYAPLYLAYHERLSHAFNWVDFDYPPALSPNRLFADFDNRHGEPGPVVLAAGDPLRLADVQPAGRVVGGLITKMCYWVCSEKARPGRKTGDIDKVFTPPAGTTGHTWASFYLKKKYALTPDELGKKLYAESRLGDPIEWYRYFQDRLNNQKLAFMTSDISMSIRHDHFEIHDQELAGEKQLPMLLTGLVTSEANWRERQGLIGELLEGIQLGVTRMNQHPRWAARQLCRYAQSDPLVKEFFATEEDAFRLVKELVHQGCYNTKRDLLIDPTWLERALAIHQATSSVASDHTRCAAVTQAACASITCAAPITPLPKDGRLDLDSRDRGILMVKTDRQNPLYREVLVAFAAVALALFAEYRVAPLKVGDPQYWLGTALIWTGAISFSIYVSSTAAAIVRQKLGVSFWRILPVLPTIIGVVWAASRALLTTTDAATSVLFNYIGFAALALTYISPEIGRQFRHWRTQWALKRAIGNVIRADYGIFVVGSGEEGLPLNALMTRVRAKVFLRNLLRRKNVSEPQSAELEQLRQKRDAAYELIQATDTGI